MSEPDRAGRPDTDDYDLLTYGEAAARLAELLTAERAELAALRRTANPDHAVIQQLEQRISLLESSYQGYRRTAADGEAFAQRFGFEPGDAATRSPQ